jgi:putative membrane-bound dehydrogenase-like protein
MAHGVRQSVIVLALVLMVSSVAPRHAAADQAPGSTPPPASEELAKFVLPKGFKIELVASEPTIINPVCIAHDEQGRLYVSESHTYRYGPKGTPLKDAAPNPIVRLDPLPDGKGYRRVLVAEGFEDPVMGMAIRGNQLWATANDFLYRFDIDDSKLGAAADGVANAPIGVNRQTIAIDTTKAWNPFGMFVLEWGPEGDLYMSVGNHKIDIYRVADEKERVSGRGDSGIVMRMKPDGSRMERLVHGLRVPYGFDVDPFGQLWVLSNGEGNPNRFVRAIDGLDYHCYSRTPGNAEWLSGRHPLAPPCFELPRGACTQLLRYYAANFPREYQGSLLLDNWGAHGFNGGNRTIFRYVPDERNEIKTQEEFISCTDPHFRCSHVLYDRDGGLLLADWYAKDDESDLTGRIWRVSYTGDDRPVVTHRLDAPEWKDPAKSRAFALAGLGSPDHLVRAKATAVLVGLGNEAVAALAAHAAAAAEPLGAANALWALVRIGTPESLAAVADGTKHGDWRVRRLGIDLLRRYAVANADAVAKQLAGDADLAVRVAAARALQSPADRRAAIVAVLKAGAAADPHLRYEAAAILAPVADESALTNLVRDADLELRLAGLIALDLAAYEKHPTADMALAMLASLLEEPGEIERNLVMDLARMHDSPGLTAAARSLVRRTDLPAAVTGNALLLLRAKAGGATDPLEGQAIKRFLKAVEAGEISIRNNTDAVTLLELLEADGPSEFASQSIVRSLGDRDGRVREAAHRVARVHGPKAATVADALWARLLNPKDNRPPADRLADLTTLLAVEADPNAENWSRLLAEGNPLLVADAVRSWRQFAGKAAMTRVLAENAAAILKRQPEQGDDLAAVAAAVKIKGAIKSQVKLPALPADDAAYRDVAVAAPSATPDRVSLGRRVFERAGCVKCHAAVAQATERAPSLAGIGKAQNVDYLVESILEPSKVIKTGFETETIVTADGKVYNGLVKEQGDTLRILTPDAEILVKKSDVDERSVQKKSLMPDGQHRVLSRTEFADLIGYLQSLK